MLHFVGFGLTTIGEILIGYSILRVHIKAAKEHKIDKDVIKEIKHEQIITILGILLILAGFFLQMPGYLS